LITLSPFTSPTHISSSAGNLQYTENISLHKYIITDIYNTVRIYISNNCLIPGINIKTSHFKIQKLEIAIDSSTNTIKIFLFTVYPLVSVKNKAFDEIADKNKKQSNI